MSAWLHFLAGEGLLGDVEVDRVGVQPGVLDDDQIRVVSRLFDVLRGQRPGDVDLAGLERLQAGRAFRNHPEDELIDLRRAAPVVRVGFQHHLAVAHPVVGSCQLERAGAGGVDSEIIEADGKRALGLMMPAMGIARLASSGAYGLRQGHADGVLIDRFDCVDPVGDEVRRCRASRGVVLRALSVRVDRVVPGHDGVSVERLAVVEIHPLAQVEGVDEIVVRNLPRFGEAGADRRRAIVIETRQS